MNKIKKLIFCTLVVMLLSACDEKDASTTLVDAQKQEASPVKLSESKLEKFLSEDGVCDLLEIDDLKEQFNISTEIKTRASFNKYSKSVTCSYDWKREDYAEREANFLSNTMSTVQGKGKKLTMRQKTPDSNITVGLGEYKFDSSRFIPNKLSEEQLQEQINKAKKAANDRLTDEQKAIAGDAANSMVENMMRKNNDNKEIAGVGKKAYWSRVGGGGLNILSDKTKIFISLMIADTEEEDMEHAKNIAKLFL